MSTSLPSNIEGTAAPIGQYGQPRAHAYFQDDTVDLFEIFRLMLRRWRAALIACFVVLAFVAYITVTTTPQYRASTQLLIDPGGENIVDIQTVIADLSSNTAVIDSEVEVLRSRSLAERVVRSLDLVNNPIFGLAAVTTAANLRAQGKTAEVIEASLSHAEEKGLETEATQRQIDSAVSQLLSMITVARLGESFVINMAVAHHDPDMAELLASEHARQYLNSQFDIRRDATREANNWIRGRLDDLATLVRDAEAAVEEYRREAGLLATRDVTLTEQDMQIALQNLAELRSQRAEQRARLRALRGELREDNEDAMLAAAIGAPEMQQLRRDLQQIEQSIAEARTRYGPGHPQMVRLQAERSETLNGIELEFERYLVQLSSELEATERLVRDQESNLGILSGELAEDGAQNVRLRELEREAETSRLLYEEFLARSKETNELDRLDYVQARVISNAVRPNAPFTPNAFMNGLIGVALAAIFGVLAAVVAEVFDRSMWTSADVERRLMVPFLGYLPLIKNAKIQNFVTKISSEKFLRSAYGVEMRTFLAGLMHRLNGRLPKVISVTSTPNLFLNRHIFVVGLAEVIQKDLEKRTLIVDGNVDGSGVSRYLRREDPDHDNNPDNDGAGVANTAVAPLGMLEAHLLPIAKIQLNGEAFTRNALQDLFSKLKTNYDVIIIDSGRFSANSNNHLIAQFADVAIVLGKWRKSKENMFKAICQRFSMIGVPIAGVLLMGRR